MEKHGLPSNAENCAAIVSIQIGLHEENSWWTVVFRLRCFLHSFRRRYLPGDIPHSRCQNNVLPIFLAIAHVRFSKHIAVKGKKGNWLKSYGLLTLKMSVVKNLQFFNRKAIIDSAIMISFPLKPPRNVHTMILCNLNPCVPTWLNYPKPDIDHAYPCVVRRGVRDAYGISIIPRCALDEAAHKPYRDTAATDPRIINPGRSLKFST